MNERNECAHSSVETLCQWFSRNNEVWGHLNGLGIFLSLCQLWAISWCLGRHALDNHDDHGRSTYITPVHQPNTLIFMFMNSKSEG